VASMVDRFISSASVLPVFRRCPPYSFTHHWELENGSDRRHSTKRLKLSHTKKKKTLRKITDCWGVYIPSLMMSYPL